MATLARSVTVVVCFLLFRIVAVATPGSPWGWKDAGPLPVPDDGSWSTPECRFLVSFGRLRVGLPFGGAGATCLCPRYRHPFPAMLTAEP